MKKRNFELQNENFELKEELEKAMKVIRELETKEMVGSGKWGKGKINLKAKATETNEKF